MTSLWTIRYVLSPLGRVHSYLTQRSDGTLNRRVAELLDPAVSANETPVDGVATFDVVIDSTTGVWVRFFVPTQDAGREEPAANDANTMPVVLYFHGGGFALIRPDDVMYDSYCRRLARCCRVVVVSVHYRRSPEHKYPTAHDDCFAALEWLNSDHAKMVLPPNADLSRTFLCGDSSGGNVVHYAGVRAAGKDLGAVKLRGLVLVQPFFGAEERTPSELRKENHITVWPELLDWFWKAYLPEDATRDHPAANVTLTLAQDVANVDMPPALVIIGGLDILQDWNRRYAEAMKKAGKRVQVCFYENAVHLFGQLNQAVVAKQMLIDVATFLRSH